MNTYPLWKSLYFESTENSVEYRIMLGGTNEIFRGQAYKSPETGKIRIKVNDICASYLDSLLEEEEVRRSLGVDTLIPMNAYAEFTLETYNSALSGWINSMEWAFVNDTSWLQRYTGEGTYSEPINGHAAPGQTVAFSYLVTDPEGQTICYNGTSLYFIITRGQAEELPDSGGTWEIGYDTNLENTYYEMRSAAYTSTGYTSGGTIDFEVLPNETPFQQIYEVTFYDKPNGIRLASAIAYIGAGEMPSGFTYFLRITSAPSYVYSGGSRETFYFTTNCNGQSHYELRAANNPVEYGTLVASGVSASLSSITLDIAANQTYDPIYYTMLIEASEDTNPTGYITADRARFEQQAKQRYFYFLTPGGQVLTSASTTNIINWDTDYDEIKWVFNIDYSYQQSGITSDSGVTLTFPINETNFNRTLTLDCYSTGGTHLGTFTFYQERQEPKYFTLVSPSYTSIPNTQEHLYECWESNYDSVAYELYREGILIQTGITTIVTAGMNCQKMIFPPNTGIGDVNYTVIFKNKGTEIGSAEFSQTGTDYSTEYFALEALESSDAGWAVHSRESSTPELFYSINGGSTWTAVKAMTRDYPVTAGDKILFKGNRAKVGFWLNTKFNVSGNIMSLLYKDNFQNQTDLLYDSTFYDLFSCTNSGQIIAADRLILPATTLTNRCYETMFLGCGLEKAPALPATTLADRCYLQMFQECNLITAPSLPATALSDECYLAMFSRCNLINSPSLPATTLADRCYYEMFEGCSSLTAAPELPATTLADRCYSVMFRGCSSLTNAPKLPATTLADRCYYEMFEGCSSLTAAPKLPATTLATGCYSKMFRGCSLITDITLPAPILVNECYRQMLISCSHLNYIKCLATDRTAWACTDQWNVGVANSGVFVKASEMSGWEEGYNGIPSGWTVENV